MELNFSAIENPTVDSIISDTVTGRLAAAGEEIDPTMHLVVVKRYLHGWLPRIRITVGDLIVHDANPDKADMAAFNELRARAIHIFEQTAEDRRAKFKQAAKVLFNAH